MGASGSENETGKAESNNNEIDDLVPKTSVGRVIKILERFPYSTNPLPTVKNNPKDSSLGSVLSEAFSVDAESTSNFLNALSAFIKEVNNARIELERKTNFTQDAYSNHFQNIEDFISRMSLEKKWANVESYFPKEALSALKIFEDLVKQECEQSEISKSQILDIKRLLVETQNSLLESGIEKELMIILSNNIDEMLNAINNYHISGLAGIEKSYEISSGSVILKRELFKKEEHQAANNQSIDLFWQSMEKMHTLIQTANQTKALMAPISHYIGG